MKVAEVQLIYKTNVKPSDRPRCSSSEEAFKVLYEWWDKDTIEHRETFAVLLLNRANRALGIKVVSLGGSDCSAVDLKIIFQAAVLSHASSIILAHNHPSGSLLTSENDIKITDKVSKAGKILGIPVRDHIVLSPFGEYYSFADDGQI